MRRAEGSWDEALRKDTKKGVNIRLSLHSSREEPARNPRKYTTVGRPPESKLKEKSRRTVGLLNPNGGGPKWPAGVVGTRGSLKGGRMKSKKRHLPSIPA